MAKIKKALSKLAEALGLQEDLLARAQRRYKANRKRAFQAHNQQAKARQKADKLRGDAQHLSQGSAAEKAQAETLVVEAGRQDKKAGRLGHVAYKNHVRAQHFLGVIKTHQVAINNIETRQSKLQEELKKLDHVTIKGNQAIGGTPGERWKAVCLASVANCQKGMPSGRRNFYSETGGWDVDHVIHPGEQYDERSDCSSTVTAWAKAAGLPDPNGANYTGGYTGTLLGQHNGWKYCSEEAMVKKGWGIVVYLSFPGDTVGHHTEAYIGPDPRTAGHGSPPVDFGVINLFGDGLYQCLILDE